MAGLSTGQCGHACCPDRGLPFHDHFLRPEECPQCASVRADLDALGKEASTALSPMERAVRRLHGDGSHGSPFCSHCLAFIALSTEDPEAAGAFLAGCGLEGHAVLGGRVVELEARGSETEAAVEVGRGRTIETHYDVYRVKQHTEGEGE